MNENNVPEPDFSAPADAMPAVDAVTVSAAAEAVPAAPSPLSVLREEIDHLDNQLLDLVQRRIEIGRSIAAAKKQAKDADTPFRPARETQILRRLIAASAPGINPEAIAEIWRAIMNVNLREQGTIEAVIGPGSDPYTLADIARGHFGGYCALTRSAEARGALQRALEADRTLAVLPWPGDSGAGGWWQMLVESRFQNLRIIGALPVLNREHRRPEAAIVSTLRPEPAGQDSTLIMGHDDHYRGERLLRDMGLLATETERARSLVLWQIDGFVAEDDPRLRTLSTSLPGLRALGAYSQI